MKNILSFVSVLLLVSCTTKSIDAEFLEIDNNLARFKIVNNSNKDIGKIIFELRFLDSSNNLLLIDTLSYEGSKEYQKENLPFLKANDGIFIVQIVPANSKKADIKVLKIDNLK